MPLLIDLSGLGITQCRLLVSPDVVLVIDSQDHVGLDIPMDAHLRGQRLYEQFVADAPGRNPAGVGTSDPPEQTVIAAGGRIAILGFPETRAARGKRPGCRQPILSRAAARPCTQTDTRTS